MKRVNWVNLTYKMRVKRHLQFNSTFMCTMMVPLSINYGRAVVLMYTHSHTPFIHMIAVTERHALHVDLLDFFSLSPTVMEPFPLPQLKYEQINCVLCLHLLFHSIVLTLMTQFSSCELKSSVTKEREREKKVNWNQHY